MVERVDGNTIRRAKLIQRPTIQSSDVEEEESEF